MKPRITAFSAACLLCSMVLFPLFALGGLIALLVLAAGVEALRVLMGEGTKREDLSQARAAAMRICYDRLHQS